MFTSTSRSKMDSWLADVTAPTTDDIIGAQAEKVVSISADGRVVETLQDGKTVQSIAPGHENDVEKEGDGKGKPKEDDDEGNKTDEEVKEKEKEKKKEKENDDNEHQLDTPSDDSGVRSDSITEDVGLKPKPKPKNKSLTHLDMDDGFSTVSTPRTLMVKSKEDGGGGDDTFVPLPVASLPLDTAGMIDEGEINEEVDDYMKTAGDKHEQKGEEGEGDSVLEDRDAEAQKPSGGCFARLTGRGGGSEKKKSTGRLRNIFWQIVKNVAPLLFILVLSLLGGLAVWRMDQELGVAFIMPTDWSKDVFAYLEAVNYVCSLYTTIGYGTLAASNWRSQVFTVLYSIIGIPAVAVVLDGVGKFFARSFWHLYDAVVLRRARQKLPAAEQKALTSQMNIEQFPIWGAILITLLWVFLTAWHFWVWASNWSYGDSMYFVFISMSTIGLGDQYPISIVSMLIGFYFIVLGLSMFSMCWTLAQLKMEAFAKRMSAKMQEKVFASIEDMKKENGDQTIDVDKLLAEQGVNWFMRKALGDALKRKLKDEIKQRANQRHANVQVMLQPIGIDQGQQCIPRRARTQHKGVQTEGGEGRKEGKGDAYDKKEEAYDKKARHRWPLKAPAEATDDEEANRRAASVSPRAGGLSHNSSPRASGFSHNPPPSSWSGDSDTMSTQRPDSSGVEGFRHNRRPTVVVSRPNAPAKRHTQPRKLDK